MSTIILLLFMTAVNSFPINIDPIWNDDSEGNIRRVKSVFSVPILTTSSCPPGMKRVGNECLVEVQTQNGDDYLFNSIKSFYNGNMKKTRRKSTTIGYGVSPTTTMTSNVEVPTSTETTPTPGFSTDALTVELSIDSSTIPANSTHSLFWSESTTESESPTSTLTTWMSDDEGSNVEYTTSASIYEDIAIPGQTSLDTTTTPTIGNVTTYEDIFGNGTGHHNETTTTNYEIESTVEYTIREPVFENIPGQIVDTTTKYGIGNYMDSSHTEGGVQVQTTTSLDETTANKETKDYDDFMDTWITEFTTDLDQIGQT